MASSITLNPTEAAQIVRGAAPLLKHLRRTAKTEDYGLFESFELFIVDGDLAQSPVLSLSAIARPTPILHHQIRNRTGKHRIFARSVREDDQNLAVAGLYSSAMAGSIDRVIARIEREWPSDNHRVSVVAIPAHNTTVLWVRSADDAAVYVVAHPRTAHVRTGQKYTEAAFVARLRGRAAATARLRRSELPERSKPR